MLHPPSPSHPPSSCSSLHPYHPPLTPIFISILMLQPPAPSPSTIPCSVLLPGTHTPSSPVLSPTRDHTAVKLGASQQQTLPHSGHQSHSMPQFPHPQCQSPHLTGLSPALSFGSHQGMQPAHRRNNNPIPKAFSALLRSVNCPLFEDGQWQASSRPRASTHHNTKSHDTTAFPKYRASITRRKSLGLLPLIGPTFPGAASQQPPSAKNHESDLQEGEKKRGKKKDKISLKSLISWELVSTEPSGPRRATTRLGVCSHQHGTKGYQLATSMWLRHHDAIPIAWWDKQP